MSGRPIRIWKTPFQRAQHLDKTTFLGFDIIRRWRWRCYICELECTYPAATLPAIYEAALRHLEDEHNDATTATRSYTDTFFDPNLVQDTRIRRRKP